MARKKMKKSQQLAIMATVWGVLAGIALGQFADVPFWGCVIGGAIIAALLYQQMMKWAAEKAVVDSRVLNDPD